MYADARGDAPSDVAGRCMVGGWSGMRIEVKTYPVRRVLCAVCCVSGREELMGLEESRYASPRTVTRLSGGRRSSVLMRLSRFEERKSKMCGA